MVTQCVVDGTSRVTAKVWVDASSMVFGVAVEVDGSVVEDTSWLRKALSCHINKAELDAIIK